MAGQQKRQSAEPGLMVERNRGIYFDAGTTVPTTGGKGYAPGAIFLDNDSTTAGAMLYVNQGSVTSCLFVAMPDVAQLLRNNQLSTREVTAGATLTITAALHEGRTVLMPAVCAITLPAATGTGGRYRFVQQVAATATTITATAADMYGVAWALSDNSAAVLAYEAAGSTIITFDGSTKGGRKGHITELEDVATSMWSVRTMGAATGTEATPFS